MVVLLEDANDGTRLTWSAVTDAKITRRVGLSPDGWTNLRGVLVRKKALIVAVPARRGRVAKYRIPVFNAAPKGHQIHDPTQKGHESDDLTTPMGHETDEETNAFVMGSVTPTPLCSSTTSPLSVPPASNASQAAAVPVEEREKSAAPTNDNDPAATVAAAWSAARGGHPNPAAERDITVRARQLLTAGWPLSDVIALAEDMARRQPTYRDLTRHADHWKPTPLAGTAAPGLPPWCGKCDGEPLAERWITVAGGVARCPDCNPHARAA